MISRPHVTQPATYSNAHYLLAKRSVDDRALNRVVFEALRRELSARPHAELRVLELGAGVGSMVHRLTQWGLIERGTYTCVDADAHSLRAAREHLLSQYAGNASFERETGSVHIRAPGIDLRVLLIEADLFAFLAASAAGCLRPCDRECSVRSGRRPRAVAETLVGARAGARRFGFRSTSTARRSCYPSWRWMRA